jgi:hypothetical protein
VKWEFITALSVRNSEYSTEIFLDINATNLDIDAFFRFWHEGQNSVAVAVGGPAVASIYERLSVIAC